MTAVWCRDLGRAALARTPLDWEEMVQSFEWGAGMSIHGKVALVTGADVFDGGIVYR
jgi:hypothetical protein